MATTYKTPDVYVEEISVFPPSVAEVATAIPAFIGYTEAAKRKCVTRQAIIKAIERGDIDGNKVSSRSLVVVANKKFEKWEPDRVRQAAGLSKRKAD